MFSKVETKGAPWPNAKEQSAGRRVKAVAVAVLLPAGFKLASANFNSGHAPHCWQSSTLRLVASSLRCCIVSYAGQLRRSIVCGSRNGAGDAAAQRGNQRAAKNVLGINTFWMQ